MAKHFLTPRTMKTDTAMAVFSASPARWPLLPLAAIFGSALLSACSPLAPNYQRPALEMPASLGAQGAAQTAVQWPQWWKTLQDPALDRLLAEAQANNQDMALAAARIQEARANVAVSNSNHYPTLDGNFGASRVRSSTTTGKLPAGVNPIAKDVQLGITAAYEVDFWGKHNRGDDAARGRLLAQEGSRALVQSSLMAEIAQRYCALRAYDAQLAVADTLFKSRQENLRLQQKRFTAGVIGELELNQAKAELSNAETALTQARQSVASTEVALALLAGRSPAAISNPQIARGASIDALYQRLSVPADLPSSLLQRRPDIISAEQNLIAANADIAQARAQYFPAIKLTGTYGRDSKSLSDLFNPGALIWSLATSVTQPLLRAGAIDAVVQGSEARKAQATAQYVQSVQSAFRDVHDALTNLEANQQVQAQSASKLATQQQSRRLAKLRFDQGYSSGVDMLNAERDLLQVQSSLIDSERTHLQAMVALYKAMGGGWDGQGIELK